MPSATPCAIVIYGASGDLAQLKLIPAIYELAREGLLNEKFVLVGYARSKDKKVKGPDGQEKRIPLDNVQFRKDCYDAVKKNARVKPLDEALWKKMESNIFYVPGGYDSPDDHARLGAKLTELDKTHQTAGNRLFYISTPPDAFEGIIKCLGEREHARRTAPGSAA